MARGMRQSHQSIVISSKYLRDEDEDVVIGIGSTGSVRGSGSSHFGTPQHEHYSEGWRVSKGKEARWQKP